MLSASGSVNSSHQYLQPDSLPATTLDSKQCPLALLAQTCNQIGSDPTAANPDHRTPTSPKATKSQTKRSSDHVTGPKATSKPIDVKAPPPADPVPALADSVHPLLGSYPFVPYPFHPLALAYPEPYPVSNHPAEPDRPNRAVESPNYTCNWMSGQMYCGLRFASADQLLNHLRVHTWTGELWPVPRLHRSYPNPPISPSSLRYQPYLSSHFGPAVSPLPSSSHSFYQQGYFSPWIYGQTSTPSPALPPS